MTKPHHTPKETPKQPPWVNPALAEKPPDPNSDSAFVQRGKGNFGRNIRRTLEGGRKHAVSLSAAAILSTVVPMIEQWHADRQVQNQIDEVKSDANAARLELKADMQKEIDDLKAAQAANSSNLWHAIHALQSQSEDVVFQPSQTLAENNQNYKTPP